MTDIILSSDRERLGPSGDAVIYPTAKIAPSVEKVVLGVKAFIGDFVFISVPRLFLGDGSQINAHTVVAGMQPVSIGRNSVIGYNCTVLTASDSQEAEFMNDASPVSKRIIRQGPVQLNDKVFIGSGSTIMPGSTIAEGVVVRAGSYVDGILKQAHYIYGGRPAKPMGPRGYV